MSAPVAPGLGAGRDMSALIHLCAFVLFAGGLQGLILALFLFTHRKGNQPANMVLGLLMIALAFDLLTSLPTAGVALPLGAVAFLYAPLIYMYTHLLLEKNPEKYRPFVLAAVPIYAVPLLLYGLTFYARLDALVTAGASAFDASSYVASVTPSPIAAVLLSLTTCAFLALSWRALGRAMGFAANAFASNAVLRIRWLRGMHLAALVLATAFLAGTLLTAVHVAPAAPVAIALRSALALLVFTIGFYGLRHPAVFSGAEYEMLEGGGHGTKPEPRGDASTDPKVAAVKALLLESMSSRKLFLDPDLTIGGLSDQLGVGQRTVSKALNEGLGQPFFEFVNAYRAKHARAMLADTAHIGKTVIGIAYESGFRSKSVFNAVFRKHVGMTPSEYRRRAMAEATGAADRTQPGSLP
ncbi:MAG: helix-turn-helix domain-containing protein [Chitinivibrionales bacterium]|nr:helix-turn-helix domain-containing protein [Chitinivibrionales bacterium]